MLLVKTYLDKSHIHGLGLFAKEFIPKGTIIWKFHPKLDIGLSKSEVDSLPGIAKESFLHYCYQDMDTGMYYLCFDDARFMNHVEKGANTVSADNPEDDNGMTVASRDISAGEEITVNYSDYDNDTARKRTENTFR